MAAGACDFLLVHELDGDGLVRAIRMAAEVARHALETERWTLDLAELEERFSTVWDLVEDGLLLVDEQKLHSPMEPRGEAPSRALGRRARRDSLRLAALGAGRRRKTGSCGAVGA